MSGSVRVRLIGGLGNQLFGYFAARSLAETRGLSLVLDTSWTRYGLSDHGIEIKNLKLPGTWLPDRRISTRILAPGSIRGRIGQRIAKDLTSLHIPLGYYYWHEGEGMESASKREPRFLRGYFQHSSFFDELEKSLPELPFELRAPSRWLVDRVDQAREEQPIGIHIRLGDYTSSLVNEALSSSYYTAAIERCEKEFPNHPIWVFSDDLSQAKRMLSLHKDACFNFIETPTGVTASSELALMNQMHAHVISNSTFSWWGARASNSQMVFYPKPWFRRGTPVGLIPEHWIPVSTISG